MCLKLHQEIQRHEDIGWRCNNDEELSLPTCLVLHISLGSFGGRGEKFVDECVGWEAHTVVGSAGGGLGGGGGGG